MRRWSKFRSEGPVGDLPPEGWVGLILVCDGGTMETRNRTRYEKKKKKKRIVNGRRLYGPLNE